MRGRTLMCGVSCVVGIALGSVGDRILNAQEASVTVVELLRADAVGMDDKEVIVQQVEFAPGRSTGRHYHPGHEAFYILEGRGILAVEGRPVISVKAGDARYIPPHAVHEGTNASATDRLILLSFRIHDKGQPVTVPVP